MKNNNHPYYNRPSITTSYQLAIMGLIGLVLLIMIMKVSEVVSDFDNTSNKIKKDIPIETLLEREVQYEGVMV